MARPTKDYRASITIKMPLDLLVKLDEFCAASGKKRSDTTAEALNRYLSDKRMDKALRDAPPEA